MLNTYDLLYTCLRNIEINENSLASFDCVLIATNHTEFDYPMIAKYVKVLVDSRGVFREKQGHIFPA